MTQPPPSAKSNKNYKWHTCPSSTGRGSAREEGLTEKRVGSGKGVREVWVVEERTRKEKRTNATITM